MRVCIKLLLYCNTCDWVVVIKKLECVYSVKDNKH